MVHTCIYFELPEGQGTCAPTVTIGTVNMFYFQGGNSIPMVRRYLGVTWALLKISLVVTVYKRRDEMDRNLIDAMNDCLAAVYNLSLAVHINLDSNIVKWILSYNIASF